MLKLFSVIKEVSPLLQDRYDANLNFSRREISMRLSITEFMELLRFGLEVRQK